MRKFSYLGKRKNKAVYQSLDIVKALEKVEKKGVTDNGVIFNCLFIMGLTSLACSYLAIK